jgi:hypothetical protein
MCSYLLVEKIPDLAMFFYNQNSASLHFSQSSLRNRFCLLLTTFGILRGESLFQCDLSDMFTIEKSDEGIHTMTILVMRIATGKTNGANQKLYGRVMRHSNYQMCPIGAMGLYFLSRFDIGGEETDFTDNSTWFNDKLLTQYGFI